ncbi:DUF3823 domain-containing protein [Chitinophaga qingshengii]|uniref:DUF3823 domain-containing protein n=1 Tax=Chitinophaga qingshengii TaxID=1569794 RepID=A0ABR7TUA4_9BACT|nr:DUF3823 domain-containing protein [Chitinophaga qingshengii]MBC9932984.1 DUF3823 domain-containing protein [Chitinophaga qingshengii]
MKQHIINSCMALLLGGAMLTGCKKDNYAAPDARIQGRLTDVKTNEPVPVQTFNGAVLRYYQQGYSSSNPNPINTAVHNDGSYTNKLLFAGKYRIVAEGPFYYKDTLVVDINGNTQRDIPVTPFLKVSAVTSDITSNSVTVKYTVKHNDNTQKISRLVAIIGTTEGIDVNSYSFNDIQDVQNVPDATVEGTTYQKVFTGLKSGAVYYIRAAARISGADNPAGYYNYTPVIKITTAP